MLFLLITVSLCGGQNRELAAAPEGVSPGAISSAEPLGEDLPTNENEKMQGADTDESSVKAAPDESRSYLQLGVQLSEGMEHNPSGLFGYLSQYSPITNLSGNATLRQVKRHSNTSVDYEGGGSFYEGYGNADFYAQQIQQLGTTQSFQWKRTQLTFRNKLRYLSQGTYGSLSLSNTALQNNPGSSTNNLMGVVNSPAPIIAAGQDSYLINISGIDLSENVTPRSSFFAGGAFSLINYFSTGESEFNSRQALTSLGYSYQLNRKDSIGATYGYQSLQYPNHNMGTITTNSAQVTYRTVKGRLSLMLSAGPSFTSISSGITGSSQQVGFAATAAGEYPWRNSSIDLNYSHEVAAGSGLFAGVTQNVVRASFQRTIDRHWSGAINGGYSRERQLVVSVPGQAPGSFAFEFAGGNVERLLGRYLSTFANYEYAGENFSNCAVSAGCNPVIRRHIVTVGLNMRLRPISLE